MSGPPVESRKIGTIAVAGAGTMGRGIAQSAIASGFAVLIYDPDPAARKRVVGLLRLRAVEKLEDLSKADLLIEAVPEKEEIKKGLFARCDPLFEPGAIFASNTSSISITRLASATRRPDRFIGMHFMNPVPKMKVVEIVRGEKTSEETAQVAREVCRRMGKEVVESKDSPGFIVNRILIPMINEAAFALMEGVAPAEEVDRAMRLAANHPMGPLAVADLIGLDVCLGIAEILHKELGDERYRSCPLLRKYVEAGRLGRKTGRGFHAY